MKVTISKEIKGVMTRTDHKEDVYSHLCKGDKLAKVSVGAGFSTSYATVKAYVSIELLCDQNKKTIEEATQLAMTYAIDVANMTMVQAIASQEGTND